MSMGGEAGQRGLELGSIAAVAVLELALAAELWSHVDGPFSAFVLVLASILSLPLADFFSGLFHWSADRLLSDRLPVLGPRFVRPFREHHADPTEMTRHDWIGTNGNTCAIIAPFLLANWIAVRSLGEHPWGLFFAALIAWTGVWTAATNQIHKWAHQPAAPAVVQVLQRRGWILSPAHHARHHAPPFDRCYCITTGWLDAWLDRGFFRALERLVRPGNRARAGASGRAG